MHMVVATEGSVAIGTLARAGSEAFFHAVLAERMAAGFNCGVLPVAVTDRT